MKYLIITYDEYINIPYVQYYENCLRSAGIAYDIILWNRRSQAVPSADNHFVFESKTGKSKFSKIIPFLRWRVFVLNILKKNPYHRIIVLTTLPGILLMDKLLGPYQKRYWFDIRDFTYESLPPYKKAVASLVKQSLITSISSEAFATFLPPCDHIVLTHNITNDTAAQEHCSLDPAARELSIAFVGGIQYFQQNKQLIMQFAAHPRFRLKYIGKVHPGCDLEGFCREQGVTNVSFAPSYRNEEKPEIYRSIDIINSIYGSDSPIVKLALPNKLYDCILFKKPILVSKGTFLADIVREYGIGLAVDIDHDNIPELLEAYLHRFDPQKFEDGCRRLLHKVREETALFHKTITQFCTGTEEDSL